MLRIAALMVGALVGLFLVERRVAPAAESANEILDRLLAKGGLNGAAGAPLPKPTMGDGLDGAAQQTALRQIADANHPLEALERKSIVAPFILKIADDDPADKKKTLRHVDIWFVAYGKLGSIADESFWKSAKDAASGDKEIRELSSSRTAMLSADELKSRGIVDPADQRHLTADMTLFNRVRVSATMQAMQTRSADSIVLAAMLDPRFADDRQFPNRWWPLAHDDNGHQQIGQPQPYRTAGWYSKATQLHQPAGALFVEYHVLFDEPDGWFNGANLLRSKLPIVVQEGVRKFRRRLSETEPAEKPGNNPK